jgi:ubiquinone/menaquinone biosynthesis C-methylase UbiE
MSINIKNRDAFNSEEAVAEYVSSNKLTACEEYVVSRYLEPQSRVLELGVGGGRCTPALLKKASAYVGLDYAEQMVKACQKRFPDLDFRTQDAADLSAFADSSFDFVIFSFNGLGYLYPATHRQKCIDECFRVLRPGGRFLFSAHNPKSLLKIPDFRGATLLKATKRVALAFGEMFQNSLRQPLHAAFWTERGYVNHSVHGGLTVYSSTPKHVSKDMAQVGFRLLETVGCFYPQSHSLYATPAYYYAFVKTQA